MSGAPVISLDNVRKRFGSAVAVEHAHFDIAPGQFFSLLGPSGCGKTTVLRMIAGFEDVTSGCIRLDGADVSAVPPYRRNVNTVFQHYALFPHLSVFDNVAFGPRTQGLDPHAVRQRVAAMLDVVRLGDLAQRRPDQLSGGQRQRVALARALVNSPRALLLDEPLSALDLKLREAMQLELRRIHREVGITFVFVTHDQDEAMTMSDRIAVMDAGRVEQVGTPEEIYQSPASAFVAGFIGVANLLVGTVEGAPGEYTVVRLADGAHAEVPTGTMRFARGDAALVMVRPERVHLHQVEPPLPANAVQVTLVERIFRGATVRFVLRDRTGAELVAHVDANGPADVARGDVLWVTWEPSAARLLPPRAAAHEVAAS